ncbi:hypothetical protein [Euzebya pacifica]|nr:hypothetical protein [Euzebya pacifica]
MNNATTERPLRMTPPEVAEVIGVVAEARSVGLAVPATARLLEGSFTIADLAEAHLELEDVRRRRLPGKAGPAVYGRARVAALRAQLVLCPDTAPPPEAGMGHP